MAAFDKGFSMGQQAWQQVLDNKRRQAQDERESERHRMAMEEGGLRLSGLRRAENQAEQEFQGRQNLTEALRGNDRLATNAALDADFEAADSLARQGAALPVAQPNLQREQGLRVAIPEEQRERRVMQLGGELAALRGDYGGISLARNDVKKLDLEKGRRAELARLSKMPDDQLADMLGGAFSADGSGVDAMLTFDPKSKKYLFASKIPGFPSQTLSKPELLNYAMGMWEAGNGDYEAGLRAQMATVTAGRAMKNQDYARADALARGNADLYFKGKAADNDAERTAIARNSARLAGDRADAQDWQLVGVSQDNKGLTQFNRRTGATRTMALPPGTDATGLFARITGAKDKVAPELSPRETLAYKKVLDSFDGQPPEPGELNRRLAAFGLDPAKFGGVDPVARYGALLNSPPPAAQASPGKQALPLAPKDRTLAKYQAMSDSAVAMYADAGDHLAKAVLRQRAERQSDAAPARGGLNIDPGY